MNKMYEFLKQNHDMKNFDHVKLNGELPEITTESIKGKRFYVTFKQQVSINHNCFIR